MRWWQRATTARGIVIVLGLLLVWAITAPKTVQVASSTSTPTTTTAAATGTATQTVSASPSPTSAVPGATPTAAATVASAPLACHAPGNGLPDRSCTPGATDPRVTQANIATTICVSGYTTTVRPPATYTNALKVDQMKLYGLTDLTPADVEEDHLIALEIGGDPRDARNLWPEPRAGANNATGKDTLENRLHAQVCAGTMTLVDAQQCIAVDWIACAAAAPARLVATPAPTAAPTNAPTAAPTAPPAVAATAPPATFAVLITSSVYGLVGAQTLEGASCNAQAKLPSGNISSAQGLAPTKSAGANGQVSWSYTKVSTTTPGTGTHTVTCTLNGVTRQAIAQFSVP